MSTTRAVIFDLDGTLVQTRLASWEVFEQINARFDLGVDRPEAYFDLFRGNMFASLRSLCRDETQADEVAAAFLALLREEYTPPMVPGMPDVVRRLAADCTLAVLSSNAMGVLRRVLTTNGLAYCFGHVFGGDITPDKKTAIAQFLADPGSAFGRRCSADYDEAAPTEPPDRATTVLVTDTAGDVAEARTAGIRAVGVAWGMHSAAELTEAGAEFVALWPQELPVHLLGEDAARAPEGACALGGTAQGFPTDCSCGCTTDPVGDPVRAAGARRRDRRRAGPPAATPPAAAPMTAAPMTAASTTASPMTPRPATPEDEVLAALRLLARRG